MKPWAELTDELERYRTSCAAVRKYLTAYEAECEVLIEKISDSPSFDDAQACFDTLHEIQRCLSVATYKFDFPLGERLRDLTYHLDRDDVYSRRYWYEKFRSGLKWPVE